MTLEDIRKAYTDDAFNRGLSPEEAEENYRKAVARGAGGVRHAGNSGGSSIITPADKAKYPLKPLEMLPHDRIPQRDPQQHPLAERSAQRQELAAAAPGASIMNIGPARRIGQGGMEQGLSRETRNALGQEMDANPADYTSKPMYAKIGGKEFYGVTGQRMHAKAAQGIIDRLAEEKKLARQEKYMADARAHEMGLAKLPGEQGAATAAAQRAHELALLDRKHALGADDREDLKANRQLDRRLKQAQIGRAEQEVQNAPTERSERAWQSVQEERRLLYDRLKLGEDPAIEARLGEIEAMNPYGAGAGMATIKGASRRDPAVFQEKAEGIKQQIAAGQVNGATGKSIKNFLASAKKSMSPDDYQALEDDIAETISAAEEANGVGIGDWAKFLIPVAGAYMGASGLYDKQKAGSKLKSVRNNLGFLPQGR